MNLKINDFFEQQLALWPLAAHNYNALTNVEQRIFQFDTFKIVAQHNPARINSSAAKVDAKSIAQRQCFLCHENRPKEQITIDFNDFEILVNPFPIFKHHLTIVAKQHKAQILGNHTADMFYLAQAMPSMAIFFNGAKCGASAPDHLHFQAGDIDAWPIFNDFASQNHSMCFSSPNGTITTNNSIGRLVYRIETQSAEHANYLKNWLFENKQITDDFSNLIAYYSNEKFYLYVIPRRNFRPWQYSAEEPQQLLISPASVEVGGVFIVPRTEHFARLTQTDISDILKQVCF